MRLTKTDVIAGYPADRVRNAMRRIGGHASADASFTHLIDPDTDPRVVAQRLHAAGLITPDTDDDPHPHWKTTLEGNRIAAALFSKPVLRSTADRAVTSMITRAEQFNATPSKFFWITRLTAFGSYTDPTVDRLGDVDIAFHLTPRVPGADPTAYTTAHGPAHLSETERFWWPQREAVSAVKSGSRVLQLIPEELITDLNPTTQVLYQYQADSQPSIHHIATTLGQYPLTLGVVG